MNSGTVTTVIKGLTPKIPAILPQLFTLEHSSPISCCSRSRSLTYTQAERCVSLSPAKMQPISSHNPVLEREREERRFAHLHKAAIGREREAQLGKKG